MRKYLFISILLFAGCTVNHDLTGTWKSGGYSLWNKIHLSLINGSLILGNTLEINTDSSWKLTGTCEVFEGRKWMQKADSLFLFPDTCWGIKNKLLNASRTDLNARYFVYKIKRRCLERRLTGAGHNSGQRNSGATRKIYILDKLEHLK